MSRSLCSTCRSIDFRKYSYESKFQAVTLGSWRAISNRDSCLFCSLVRDAIASKKRWPSSGSIIKLSNRKSWQYCISHNEYHGIRQSDYSNEFDLQAYSSKTRTLARYQFVVYWKVYKGEYFQVYLRPLLPGPFFGRPVDRDHVNLALCGNWLDGCDDYHSGAMDQCVVKRTSRRLLEESFRLIDVKNMIIVQGSASRVEYVALTYVWGEDILKRENPPGWEMPRTLRAAVHTDEDGIETIKLPKDIPCTIRDAIKVTGSLGYRYLWVDSLCIIQDDEKDQGIQLGMMDEIYSNAALTIAAGSGLHADWGLPGVSRRRRRAQRSDIVGGVELAVPFPSFEELNAGSLLAWNTRGWTLQEKVYFRCANSVCAEDIAMETGVLSDTIKRRQNPFAWGAHIKEPGLLDELGDFLTFSNWKLTDKNWKLDFLPNYVALVSEYTRRTFSFSQDKLKAIYGVLRTLDPSERAFPGGLPRAWLAESLLWQPRDYGMYNLDNETSGIPTWSWAAWSLSEGCVWTQYARPDAIACDEPPTTIHVKQHGGPVKSYCVRRSYSTLFGSRKTPVHSLSKNARQLLEYSSTLLSFWTSINKLWIGEAIYKQDFSEDTLQTYYLLDSSRKRVGTIWTCDRVARLRRQHEFIALSSRRTGAAIKDAVADKHIPTTTDGEGHTTKKTASSWKVKNVMLVDWNGDVAYRVAVGQVISTIWKDKKKRLIYLG